MRYVLLLGRILYSAIFILAGLGHFSRAAIHYAESMGLLMADLLVPLAGIIAILGGVSILLGYKAKAGAWLIVIFLIPVSLTMHGFWMFDDPMQIEMQKAMFFKNMSMLGAALMIAYFGSGSLSIERRT